MPVSLVSDLPPCAVCFILAICKQKLQKVLNYLLPIDLHVLLQFTRLIYTALLCSRCDNLVDLLQKKFCETRSRSISFECLERKGCLPCLFSIYTYLFVYSMTLTFNLCIQYVFCKKTAYFMKSMLCM